MNIDEIISDSLRYPFRNWKKILFLGIIILFSNIADSGAILGPLNVVIVYFLVIVGYIIGFFGRGYMFRIMKSTLKDVVGLPNFNNWVEMFIDGIKVTIVSFVYASPSVLIMLFFMVLNFNFALASIGSNTSNFTVDIILGSGIWGLMAILYVIIIIPILSIAIAHMANNNSKISAAFKFTEILNKISIITWSKLIKWYIATLLILFALSTITSIIFVFINLNLERLLIYLVVTPYFSIYTFRSAALIYISDESGEENNE